MATSESDGDFESADEELGRGMSSKRNIQATTYWTSPTTVDSESDDDTEYVQHMPCRSSNLLKKHDIWITTLPDVPMNPMTAINDNKTDNNVKVESDVHMGNSADCIEKAFDKQEGTSSLFQISKQSISSSIMKNKDDNPIVDCSKIAEPKDIMSKAETTRSAEVSRTSRQNSSRQQDAKKLGTKITKHNISEFLITDSIATEQEDEHLVKCLNKESTHSENKDSECRLPKKPEDKLINDQFESQSIDNMQEMDMPEELKSNKKFKDVFQPEGWEGLGNDIELPDELTEEKLQPILERLSLASKEPESSSDRGNWGNWGNWGVTSLINTATAGVSTLTNHVSQGLTLFENTTEIAQAPEMIETKQEELTTPSDAETPNTQVQESSLYDSFGFGNIISGVSSITKLVELTGSKVMTGGLDTLEAIGKKTMEVLQDGDPGLKKKRAFFMNEADKPILSQILREAKEKAETEERTLEERILSRKVHFETLFDDYQGLVHLEALEILSKQSNMKIQQHLIELDSDELTSMQETLEEIKELCDLGDEDDGDKDKKDFKTKLETACHDLGVDITYEKLNSVWTETETYLASSSAHTSQEIFQSAISTLAQFTALSVERFHKTAELLLVKERRSTVNEADALVELTNILSKQISSLANLFCDTLNRFTETSEKAGDINANITTIFLEAANANSYIQDAFRLLIPILQIGAI
ncbi:protein FAM114A2 [Harpegnathos saltator]|uniref:Protein FAM114A2 n=1 Tax=Harpegnathos saltator TaxID=610380 RepID=E2B2E0_HARSA|nr:protein FAM114A2 [Harpegnathos saltator]EFN90129.1 Protein FAM114A2 [Harpegnathos saltator]